MYNLRNQQIDFFFHPQYIKPEVHNGKLQRSRTEVGDLIMNIVGPPLGKLAIIPSDLPESNFNQAAVLIRPYMYKEILVNYLFYYLSEMSEINSISTKGSAGQVNISLTQSQNMRIALPPLNEQVRIVKEVRKWFTYVDSIDSNACELEELIDNTKQSILRMAIQGKLVKQNPSDEPAIDLLKRINPNIQIPCDNPHYQNIPQSWCICTMADIAVSELGKTLDKEKNKGEYKPYLCSANVLWNRFDLSGLKQMRFEDDETDRYSIKKNDLIICEGGDAGRCAVWTSDDTIMFQNALHRVRFYHGISPYYIMYVLMFLKQNGLLEEYCKGVTIKHFTKTALSSLQIPLPPIGEQYRIVSKIEEYFCILSNIKTAIK